MMKKFKNEIEMLKIENKTLKEDCSIKNDEYKKSRFFKL